MNKKTFKIERMGSDGEGIAYLNKKPVFIYYSLIGEVVEADLFKNKRGHYEANLLNIIKESDEREEVSYKYYMKTGSINLLHMKYFDQLRYKRNVLNFLMSSKLRKETNKTKLNLTIGSKNELYYRNKTDIPIIFMKGKNVLANYYRGSNKLFPIDEFIIEEKSIINALNDITNSLDEFNLKAYNYKTKKGDVFSLSVRTNEKNQLQVMLNTNVKYKFHDFAKSLIRKNKNIISIYTNYVPNYKSNLDIYDGELKLLIGEKYLEMTLNKMKFYLTPLSFFQLNTNQALVLYNEIIKQVNFNKDDLVLDAYSGVGTIASFISPYVKEVVAIESIKDAVLDMEYSLKKNKIENVKAITGDLTKMNSYLEKNYVFDKVIFDPPRVGLEAKVLKYLLSSKPKEIIYVSCNPRTLMEDLKVLSKEYNIKYITPIDMFPQTSQIESLTILKLK